MRKLLGRLFLILAVTVVVVVGGYAWWLHPGYEARPFTSAAWADSDTEGRGHMVDDLLATHTLEGKTQEEILGLLGAPDGSMTEDGPDRASDPRATIRRATPRPRRA